MTFQEQLQAAQRRLKRVQAALAKTLLFEEGKSRDLAYEQSFDFAYEAEKLTLLARDLPDCSGHPEAKKMLDALLENVIQEWLGHANISITMDVYGHMDLRDKSAPPAQ